MAEPIRTVGDLIGELSKLDAGAAVISLHPPFDGVRLVPQDNGRVLIAPPARLDSNAAFHAGTTNESAA